MHVGAAASSHSVMHSHPPVPVGAHICPIGHIPMHIGAVASSHATTHSHVPVPVGAHVCPEGHVPPHVGAGPSSHLRPVCSIADPDPAATRPDQLQFGSLLAHVWPAAALLQKPITHWPAVPANAAVERMKKRGVTAVCRTLTVASVRPS
jgi:hypothetical protein